MGGPESSPDWKAIGAWVLVIAIALWDLQFSLSASLNLWVGLLVGGSEAWSFAATAPVKVTLGAALMCVRFVLLGLLFARAKSAVAFMWAFAVLAILLTLVSYLDLPVPEGGRREVWEHWGNVIGAIVGTNMQAVLMLAAIIFAARRGVLNNWGL